jgi:hypothetical protein
MNPQPLYGLEDQEPAYHLRYTWCGWPSGGVFEPLPDEAWQSLIKAWETDGLRLLEQELRRDRVLLTFSTTPTVSPVFLSARAKGRLQHAFRSASGKPVEFSRKLAVRSVGDNSTEAVQEYIESQVENTGFVDPRFAGFLQQFTVKVENVPKESRSHFRTIWHTCSIAGQSGVPAIMRVRSATTT